MVYRETCISCLHFRNLSDSRDFLKSGKLTILIKLLSKTASEFPIKANRSFNKLLKVLSVPKLFAALNVANAPLISSVSFVRKQNVASFLFQHQSQRREGDLDIDLSCLIDFHLLRKETFHCIRHALFAGSLKQFV